MIVIGVALGLMVLAWIGWYAYSYLRLMRGWVGDVIENPAHRRRLKKTGKEMARDLTKEGAKEAVHLGTGIDFD